MQAVLIVLLYGGALWLALMALGYLRPRGLTAAWGQSPHKVDPRSPHAILDAGLTIGDQPVALPPVARERVYRNAMALAARKPHLLFAIGRVVAFLKPATPEEVDAAIDAAVASVGLPSGPRWRTSDGRCAARSEGLRSASSHRRG